MGLAEQIAKTQEVITGILGIVTTVNTAVPIIQSLLGLIPPQIAQEFPPERIQQIIDDYEAKELIFDEKFLPPSDELDDDDNP